MGSKASNSINEEDHDLTNKLMQDILKKFTIEFAKAYTQAVVQRARLEIEQEYNIKDGLKLETAPIPSEIIKKGHLTKRGNSMKTWKTRLFVAFNEKDNFKIDYLDGTHDKGKLKGTIYCAGYRAEICTFNEMPDIGDFGLKIVPWNYRRRTWYIKCANSTEQKEWLSVFENACYQAKVPRDEDECIATAFDVTLRNIRWHFWFWGWYPEAGPESERLGEFILDLLDREILNNIIKKIPDTPAKRATIDLVQKTIGSSVKAATTSCWISSITAVRNMSLVIQNSVHDLITPLLEKQKLIKEKITEKVLDTLNPFLASKGAECLKPILDIILKPIVDAFAYAIKGFFSDLDSKITAREFEASRFNATLETTYWQMDWWNGPLHTAYETLYYIYSTHLATVTSLFTGGMSAYLVYQIACDDMKLIIRRAVYTFGQLAKSISEGELPKVLAHVTALLIHDSYIMVKSVISYILERILAAPIEEMVITPCNKLIEPIQAMIDEIPIPGLPILFDLPTMLIEVLHAIEMGSIDSLISGYNATLKASLSKIGKELGIETKIIDELIR